MKRAFGIDLGNEAVKCVQLVRRGRERLATIGGTWDDVAFEMIEHLETIAAAPAT